MVRRRDLLLAAAALSAGPARADAAARVTLLHTSDLHAQLLPCHFREGEEGDAPHPLSARDFDRLARELGPMGGLDRIATIVAEARAERPGRVLLLDGGDGLQGSWTALRTRGEDMVEALRLLAVDATTGHWEFAYGAERAKEVAASLPLLAQNVFDTEWEEPVFEASRLFERGGVAVGVIGQAFPYTPVANPRRLVPDWSFGIREERLRERVAALRAEGAEVVVLLSHNGLGVDRKLAGRVEGLDVILSGHTHDALAEPVVVGRTLICGSGAHGKFLTRLDLRVEGGRVAGFRHALVPVLAERVAPDPAMAAHVARARAPFAAEMARVVGRTETTLWRRGTLGGPWDSLVASALMERNDAEIALTPGFRWGPALPAPADITAEEVWQQTAITYPETWRRRMTGARIKALLEDVADNLFHPDPYFRQGGDMVRAGGLGFALDAAAPMGARVSDLTLLRTGAPLDPAREYAVASWASAQEEASGPPVWEQVFAHLARGPVSPQPVSAVRLLRRA